MRPRHARARRSRVRVSAAVLMVVLAAARRGIVGEIPGEQRRCGSVRRALHAAIEADARLRERHLHAAADAAADDGIDAVRCEQLGRALVQLAAGRHDLARLHGAVRDRIDLERRGLAEMLEDLLRGTERKESNFPRA